MTLSSQILLYLGSVEIMNSCPAGTLSYRANQDQYQVLIDSTHICFVSHHTSTDLGSFLEDKYVRRRSARVSQITDSIQSDRNRSTVGLG
jgi:hypothetical protein